jgi:DNA-binding LytR/AlgR family response regulator
MLNCVVVDDEQFSIEGIAKYIKLIPRLFVAGIFMDPLIAIEQVMKLDNIDILFMDVNMPNISGIELAKVLRPKVKKLIFTTSHSIYAFEAFEVEADAYLLKPYSFAKFVATINRLFPIEDDVDEVEHSTGGDYFLVKNTDENLRIETIFYNEVIAFESLNNYVKIYLTDERTITAYLTIHDVLDLLCSRKGFKQFHRSYIVATQFISYIESSTIKMRNKLVIPVGDRFKSDFQFYLTEKLATTSRKKSTT